MAKGQNGGAKKVVKQIGKEAARQLRGFPDDFRRQALSGWGEAFARQIFGTPGRNRRRGR